MSGSVEKAALELRTGGMSIVLDENGGTLVLGALFTTGRVIEFVDREARGPVCLALPVATGGARVEPVPASGTLPELDQRAAAVRSLAERLAAGRRLGSGPLLPPDASTTPAGVALERLDAVLRLASLAGLGGAALVCPIRNENGTAAGAAALAAFARRHDLPKVAAAEVLAHGSRRFEPRTPRRRSWRARIRPGSRVAPAGIPTV